MKPPVCLPFFFYEYIGNSTSKSLVLKPSLKLADDTKEWFFKRDIFEEERRLMEDSWFVGKKMALIFGRVLEMVHFFLQRSNAKGYNANLVVEHGLELKKKQLLSIKTKAEIL